MPTLEMVVPSRTALVFPSTPFRGSANEVCRLLKLGDGIFDSALLAGGWNLLSQTGLPCLLECARRGVDVHVAGVFNSGLIVGGSIYACARKGGIAGRSGGSVVVGAHGCRVGDGDGGILGGWEG